MWQLLGGRKGTKAHDDDKKENKLFGQKKRQSKKQQISKGMG